MFFSEYRFLALVDSAGVNRISYWPSDAEISLLSTDNDDSSHQDAILDATAAERLKSNSRIHICVLLQSLGSNMLQFVDETSQNCEFLEKIAADNLDVADVFKQERMNNLSDFSGRFLVDDEEQHRCVLNRMGLENFCVEPNFGNLRQHMKDLIKILASVAAGVPVLQRGYGFFTRDLQVLGSSALPQDVVRHCIIQARLLACRTGESCLF